MQYSIGEERSRVRQATPIRVAAMALAVALAVVLAATLAGCAGEDLLPSGHVRLTAENVAFDPIELAAPAGRPLVIELTNRDAGIVHRVEIQTLAGRAIFTGTAIETGRIDYEVAPLEPGRYTFLCIVHPIPSMTGTLTVR